MLLLGATFVKTLAFTWSIKRRSWSSTLLKKRPRRCSSSADALCGTAACIVASASPVTSRSARVSAGVLGVTVVHPLLVIVIVVSEWLGKLALIALRRSRRVSSLSHRILFFISPPRAPVGGAAVWNKRLRMHLGSDLNEIPPQLSDQNGRNPPLNLLLVLCKLFLDKYIKDYLSRCGSLKFIEYMNSYILENVKSKIYQYNLSFLF